MTGNPLGETIAAPEHYDPGILYPIARSSARQTLGIDNNLPMYGFDHWHAFELSWLNSQGKPEVAVAEFFFDADSEYIVESKSLKLYLNSLNQERLEGKNQLASMLGRDLSAISKSQVKVHIFDVEDKQFCELSCSRGRSIDNHQVEVSHYLPCGDFLATSDKTVVEEELSSQLFRSNCPVTGAPDWARVLISYSGLKIDQHGLIKYLCSYRQHQGYHEECAERIYRDLMLYCKPQKLILCMNYLRRGGLDINVYRSSAPISYQQILSRISRQ
ncbi:MAG: NADPH-dependent 7-cyano-7-deazaguanine reductase QueF [Gammaproteobacteria bacterium]|nr:NADPH-dependent 7-cyano-7-deazaguanine reductase QueF [Gammaproteobacteria bacterium]